MSSAAGPTATFLANLRASGLLSAGQFQELEAWIAAHQPDVPAVAKELSRRGWLTPFQIREIFKGRGRELTLDRYVLLDLLGEGGMGRVYKAYDRRMGRTLALKVIRTDKLKHPAAAARFEQEIHALSKMSHPNVVTVFDAGQAGGTHFYVMEYIDGTDLTKIVRDRGPLPIPEACEIIRQAALGLQHAHEQGLVHRDIKPSNILVSTHGRGVKLVDLGLARLLDAERNEEAHRITQEGYVIGTPDFLAPEQARNPMNVDIRADIYALGGTLYYLLTGKVPFEGVNPTEKLLKHCTEPPPRLIAERPDAPPQLDQIIQWCLAKQPEARPQTPLQLALALQPFCPPPASFVGASPGTPQPLPVPPVGVPPGVAAPVVAGPAVAAGAVAYPVPPAGYPGGLPPGFPPAPAPDPNRSSQLFKLPPPDPAEDPIRRRAEGGFPWAGLLIVLGGVFVASLIGWAVYLQFLRSREPPLEPFVNSLGMRMVRLEGGQFLMGSSEDEPGRRSDEGPPHLVTISGPFLMSATEVTHAQFLRLMGSSPSKSAAVAHRAQNLPVEYVTWDEAVDFCRKLTEEERRQQRPWVRSGWAYRLPTEAEWEYAARAGSTAPFAFGNQIVFGRHALFRPTEDDPLGIAEEGLKPPPVPQTVGKTVANAFGLHDLHGNVAEWCLDWYKPGYGDAPQVDPSGPADGDRRVIRGGSFRLSAAEARSAWRGSLRPNERRDDVGFRIVYAPGRPNP